MDDQLKRLADDPPLFDAVKARILDEFRVPFDVSTLSNLELGERYRALIEGAARIEKAFASIKRLETRSSSTTSQHPGR